MKNKTPMSSDGHSELHVLSIRLKEYGAIQGIASAGSYRAPEMQVDGYWFRDDGISLDLFLVDMASCKKNESLTRSEVDELFKLTENFFIASAEKGLYENMFQSGYAGRLAKDISDRAKTITKVNIHLCSMEYILPSEKLNARADKTYQGWTFTYNVWDLWHINNLPKGQEKRREEKRKIERAQFLNSLYLSEHTVIDELKIRRDQLRQEQSK